MSKIKGLVTKGEARPSFSFPLFLPSFSYVSCTGWTREPFGYETTDASAPSIEAMI